MEQENPIQEPLWTKDFILACMANLMVFTSMYCLLSTLPIYATEVLKTNATNVGYIFGTFALAAVLARPLAGYYLDTLGRRPVLFTSLGVLIMVLAAYNLAASMSLLLIIRGLHGLCWGFSSTASGTVASDIVPASRRGEGIGYYGLANTFAMAVGPIIGLELLRLTDFAMLFNTSFGIAIIGFICLLGIKYQKNLGGKGQASMSFASLFEPRVFTDAGITFFIAVLYGGIISFAILFGKELGIANAGSYFLAYASTLVLSRPYAGRAYDKNGPVKIMTIGFSALAAGFLLLFLANGYAMFMASALFMGVGYGIVQSTTMAMAIGKVEPHRRGAANGTVFTAFDLGIGVGAILLGVFAKSFGMAYMYLLCAFIVIIPAGIFYSYSVRPCRRPADCDGC